MLFLKQYWFILFLVLGILVFIKPILCLSLIGLIFILIGIAANIHIKKIRTNGIECQGRIIKYESDGDGGRTPIVEFTTKNGELIKETPLIYSSIIGIEILDSWKKMIKPVSILYDRDDPKKFLIVNKKGINDLSAYFFILFGLAFLVISICNLLGYIKFN